MATVWSRQSGGYVLPNSSSSRVEEEEDDDDEKMRPTSAPTPSTYQCVDHTELALTSGLAHRQSGTYVHAELLVLNHFYRRNLAFAEDIAYIGCSKLSCYCCHLYMQLHPRATLSRPCHGNTWARWAMPVPRIDRYGKSSSQDIRLLAGMVHRMQQEIETSALTGAVDRQLESTTGFSG
ncbi:hypothetical protein LTR51_008636 [Lithohypha guttulata]|nr:hypothetical protein LTR51_008636 [Lithohypha guttulata]